MSNIKNFEDLKCWKACRELSRFVSKLVKKIPRDEYDFKDTIRRAARSTTRNIAEGYERFHFQENSQFCLQSRGSLYEVWDDLITCDDESYISKVEFEESKSIVNKALAILNGYINYLQSSKEKISNEKTRISDTIND